MPQGRVKLSHPVPPQANLGPMVFQFHRDAQRQFDQQRAVTAEHIIPFIEARISLGADLRVLEIGCAEGGVLKAFLDRDAIATGVELSATRYDRARHLLHDPLQQGRLTLVRKDIYEVGIEREVGGPFDLIILKDVIEHIPHQGRLLRRLKAFLHPEGSIFFGFPPWQMPFGGHQQVCASKLLSVMPYFHLLPRPLYRGVLRMFGETDAKIADLLEVKETGLSLEKFEGLLRKTGYRILKRRLYLVNPIYRYKFGLKPREQFRLIARLPFLRNFVTTCGYYLVRPEGASGED